MKKEKKDKSKLLEIKSMIEKNSQLTSWKMKQI